MTGTMDSGKPGFVNSTMNTRKIPKVTVVLPAYNSAATIRRALDSICAQSFRDFEIIAVDDGSSDETVAVIEAAGIETLTLLRHEKNRGAAAARNTALQSARGDLVALVGGDVGENVPAQELVALTRPSSARAAAPLSSESAARAIPSRRVSTRSATRKAAAALIITTSR